MWLKLLGVLSAIGAIFKSQKAEAAIEDKNDIDKEDKETSDIAAEVASLKKDSQASPPK